MPSTSDPKLVSVMTTELPAFDAPIAEAQSQQALPQPEDKSPAMPMTVAGQRRRRIVVVGGGAGGLELVTWLGDKLGKHGKAEVTLVERARTHLWKPLLHEIAAGSMDLDDHALD